METEVLVLILPQALGWGLVSLLLLLLLSRCLHTVYCLFSILRSPLYSPSPSMPRTLATSCLLLLHPLLSSLLLLSCSLLLCSHPLTTSRLSSTPLLPRLAELVAVARALRWLWQDPTSAVKEVAALTVIRSPTARLSCAFCCFKLLFHFMLYFCYC